MKTPLLAGLATLLLATAAPAQETRQPTPAAAVPSEARASTEFAALEQFLSLSDAELAELEQVIARLRQMKPAERVALREQMAAFCRMPEAQRMQMRQGWGGMPPHIHAAWREMMHGATDERRSEIHAQMQSLPPAEVSRYRQNLVESYLKTKAPKE